MSVVHQCKKLYKRELGSPINVARDYTTRRSGRKKRNVATRRLPLDLRETNRDRVIVLEATATGREEVLKGVVKEVMKNVENRKI